MPNNPADKQSDDERSNAKSEYAIANNREAHIALNGPTKGRRLQQSLRNGSIIAIIVTIAATTIYCCCQQRWQQRHCHHRHQLPLPSTTPRLAPLAPSHRRLR
jgi:hypothetical protein